MTFSRLRRARPASDQTSGPHVLIQPPTKRVYANFIANYGIKIAG